MRPRKHATNTRSVMSTLQLNRIDKELSRMSNDLEFINTNLRTTKDALKNPYQPILDPASEQKKRKISVDDKISSLQTDLKELSVSIKKLENELKNLQKGNPNNKELQERLKKFDILKQSTLSTNHEIARINAERKVRHTAHAGFEVGKAVIKKAPLVTPLGAAGFITYKIAKSGLSFYKEQTRKETNKVIDKIMEETKKNTNKM